MPKYMTKYSTYQKSLEAREDLMQKRCFCSPLSTTVFNQIFSTLVCAWVEVVRTPLIFFRFFFTFPEVLLAGSKSLWNAERTLCKWGHFGLFCSWTARARETRLFSKNRPALALYQVWFSIFLIDISKFHLKLKNEKVKFPFFPLPSLCFLSRQRKSQSV